MVLEYILSNLLPLGIAIAGSIAWFFDKRKREAELKSILAQNKLQEATALQSMQDVYDKFVEDVKIQISELREENAILRARIRELEKQLIAANEERLHLIEQINNFKEQSQKDTKLIAELKGKVEGYEKNLKIFRKENSK